MRKLYEHEENTVAVLLAACVLRVLPNNGFTCHNIIQVDSHIRKHQRLPLPSPLINVKQRLVREIFACISMVAPKKKKLETTALEKDCTGRNFRILPGPAKDDSPAQSQPQICLNVCMLPLFD
jgi:hypothetical protein